MMPTVACPIPDYITDNLDAAVVATLITVHSAMHIPGTGTVAKVEKVKRPIKSTAGSSEEWTYFEKLLSEYVEATKLAGRDKVVKLLECCDEPLLNDLTRSAGGSLTAILRLSMRNLPPLRNSLFVKTLPESSYITCSGPWTSAVLVPACTDKQMYADL